VQGLVARLEAEFDHALSATGPGSLYVGTATPAAQGPPEPILLRITSRSADGGSLEAAVGLASMDSPPSRPHHRQCTALRGRARPPADKRQGGCRGRPGGVGPRRPGGPGAQPRPAGRLPRGRGRALRLPAFSRG
jgi:hypothetical protein